MSNSYRFSCDRGGTFTDVYCEVRSPEGVRKVVVKKILSEDPEHYGDAPREAIRRIMEQEEGKEIPTPKDIDTSQIEWIRMGTTVATNALLERKGENVVLVTTKGFRDLLQIGNQSRPDIFAIHVKKPSLLYKKVVVVDERVRLIPNFEDPKLYPTDSNITKGNSGESILIEKEPDVEKVTKDLLEAKKEGYESVAVLFLHSYTFPNHELKIGEIARSLGFRNISLSHQVMPMIRAVSRGLTCLVDAYLSPILCDYVQSFCSGFKDNLEGVDVEFMQSDGGLTSAKSFTGSKAIFSGPAGGVVGFSETGFKKHPTIGFDMGGTSTDVSRFSGTLEHVYDVEIAGCSIQVPQLDINTVAAGGGSRLFFKTGRFLVGPESSGAQPGPVCYGKNGFLSVTDANLLLGRLIPEYFPKIFGESEDQPLDYKRTKKEFIELTKVINSFRRLNVTSTKLVTSTKDMTIEEVAQGFLDVANEQMARPIRSITVSRGYDSRDHVLCAFGGAAGQHACSVARLLGMKKIRIHKHSGILSAVGLSMASVVEEEQEPVHMEYSDENLTNIFEPRLSYLEERGRKKFDEKKYSSVRTIRYLNLRYDRTDYAIMTFLDEKSNDKDESYREVFEIQYQKEYGFRLPNRRIMVDDIRVRLIGKTFDSIDKVKQEEEKKNTPDEPISCSMNKMFVENKWVDVPVYEFEKMKIGDILIGPCIVLQNTSTVVVLPDCELGIDNEGNIEINLHEKTKRHQQEQQQVREEVMKKDEVDPILLSIFSHRFMSIAEQMGRTLQRISISTNIKERLDFSCAIFGPDGNLVASAQHLPVHLGSMADAIRYQIQNCEEWKRGEVVMSNHPSACGTHLPDITIMTPVYHEKNPKPIFYVASRGHHAEIGGITPGSMPPFSKFLSDEGAQVMSFKIVRDGEFQNQELLQIMSESRNVKDNIADLKAQIAANQKGIELFQDLIIEYGLGVVHKYMMYIQENAEKSVREMLKEFARKTRSLVHQARDYMDDGSIIELKVTLDEDIGSAVFDFTGTSGQVLGNTNAPISVTTAAVLYCLRCLIQEDIPLNDGCLKPISIIVPKNSILNPSEECAVVGGNVLTSQRITDVVFRCFQAVAASQGCMNNFTFGDDTFGYYETICGGSGAGDGFQGCDAIHTHMTNTRITDPEILEQRYPIILRNFEVREGSGGKGLFRGGDGVIRKYEFEKELIIGILSERRVFRPYGLCGGEPGEKGVNILKKLYVKEDEDGVVVEKSFVDFSLGGKNQVKVNKGDMFEIHSPGGGGFGKEQQQQQQQEEEEEIEGES